MQSSNYNPSSRYQSTSYNSTIHLYAYSYKPPSRDKSTSYHATLYLYSTYNSFNNNYQKKISLKPFLTKKNETSHTRSNFEIDGQQKS